MLKALMIRDFSACSNNSSGVSIPPLKINQLKKRSYDSFRLNIIKTEIAELATLLRNFSTGKNERQDEFKPRKRSEIGSFDRISKRYSYTPRINKMYDRARGSLLNPDIVDCLEIIYSLMPNPPEEEYEAYAEIFFDCPDLLPQQCISKKHGEILMKEKQIIIDQLKRDIIVWFNDKRNRQNIYLNDLPDDMAFSLN